MNSLGRLSAALFFNVLSKQPSSCFFLLVQTQSASFNSLIVTGRIAAAKIVNGASGDFLAVTLLSTCSNDGETLAYSFTNNAGLMSLHQAGWLPVGREVTLTGHINGIKSAYKAPDGSVKLLLRPEVKLTSVQIMDGGLGRMPQTAAAKAENLGGMTITVDEAPAFGEATPVEDGTPVF